MYFCFKSVKGLQEGEEEKEVQNIFEVPLSEKKHRLATK
jgi:hypothetical protein